MNLIIIVVNYLKLTQVCCGEEPMLALPYHEEAPKIVRGPVIPSKRLQNIKDDFRRLLSIASEFLGNFMIQNNYVELISEILEKNYTEIMNKLDPATYFIICKDNTSNEEQGSAPKQEISAVFLLSNFMKILKCFSLGYLILDANNDFSFVSKTYIKVIEPLERILNHLKEDEHFKNAWDTAIPTGEERVGENGKESITKNRTVGIKNADETVAVRHSKFVDLLILTLKAKEEMDSTALLIPMLIDLPKIDDSQLDICNVKTRYCLMVTDLLVKFFFDLNWRVFRVYKRFPGNEHSTDYTKQCDTVIKWDNMVKKFRVALYENMDTKSISQKDPIPAPSIQGIYTFCKKPEMFMIIILELLSRSDGMEIYRLMFDFCVDKCRSIQLRKLDLTWNFICSIYVECFPNQQIDNLIIYSLMQRIVKLSAPEKPGNLIDNLLKEKIKLSDEKDLSIPVYLESLYALCALSSTLIKSENALRFIAQCKSIFKCEKSNIEKQNELLEKFSEILGNFIDDYHNEDFLARLTEEMLTFKI